MPNPVVHFEVHGKDRKKSAKFFSDLFGWHVESLDEMNYGMVDTHGGDHGINGGIAEAQGDPHVVFYVEVDDLQAFLDKAESLGGKTVMPVTEVPGVVTLAQFSDPDGVTIGLVKSDET
ncbi:MAG: VOC family protein [Chloroflexi bacterium]|nr:VOC family protein [Chloroflexota bacterium]